MTRQPTKFTVTPTTPNARRRDFGGGERSPDGGFLEAGTLLHRYPGLEEAVRRFGATSDRCAPWLPTSRAVGPYGRAEAARRFTHTKETGS